jgi:hypothetical protein
VRIYLSNLIPGEISVNLVKGLALCKAFMLLYLNVHAGQDIPDSLQAMLNGAMSASPMP